MASKSRTVSLELTTSNQDIYTVPNNYEAEVKSIYRSTWQVGSSFGAFWCAHARFMPKIARES